MQDAALKPEGLPAMPSALRSQVQASDNDEDAEIFALQSLTRFVASDLQVRPRLRNPRELADVEPLPAEGHISQEDESAGSTIHSDTSGSNKSSSTTSDEEASSQPVAEQAPEIIGKQTSSGELADSVSSRDALTNVRVEMNPTLQEQAEKLGLRSCAPKVSGQTFREVEHLKHFNPPKPTNLRVVRHLRVALILTSVIELCLLSGSLIADHFWSPCRTKLDICKYLHEMDCEGKSCQDCAPFWASAWPAAGLFLAVPMQGLLRLSNDSFNSSCSKTIPFVLVALLGVALLGVGAVVLVESTTAALHYAARCPMRKENSRCTANLCPSPPCRRESDFSPCLCGLLGEAEFARALFLQGSPACHPYEWYTWQMRSLQEFVLQYESFACVAGPLTCMATGVGGALFFIQLACCPLVLIGQWGGHSAICILLGQLDGPQEAELKQAPEGVQPDVLGAKVSAGSKRNLLSPSSTSLILNSEAGNHHEESEEEDCLRGSFKQRRTWDGDVSPELSH